MASALTIARSLHDKGVKIYLGASGKKIVSRRSRAVFRYLQYPDPLEDQDKFLDWFEQCIRETHFDLIIPVTERTLVPISSVPGEFHSQPIAMASVASLEKVLNKVKTIELASSVGINSPSSIEIQK